MNLLATIAAIIAFIAIPVGAHYLVDFLAIRLAKLVRHTRNNAETDDAELCGFFIVPEAINSIHDGDK